MWSDGGGSAPGVSGLGEVSGPRGVSAPSLGVWSDGGEGVV